MKKLNRPSVWLQTMLLILVATMQNPTTGYEYVLNSEPDSYRDEVHYVNTGTVLEIGGAGAYAYEDGYALCAADAYTQVDADDASLTRWAWARVTHTWEWNGPPGSTPPGGTLYWENDADGSATVSGASNPKEDGEATSEAKGQSATWVDPDPGDYGSDMEGWAYGSVTDENMAQGEASVWGRPEAPWSDPNEGYIGDSHLLRGNVPTFNR